MDRSKIDSLNIGNSEIQEFGEPNTILIRLEKADDDNLTQEAIIAKLKDNLADDIDKSVINEQVENGVAVRMACLSIMVK